MANAMNYARTRQGLRDLDHPMHDGMKVNVGSTERALSAGGAAILVGLGLNRGGLLGLAMVAAGGALILRAATGHCSLYAATGTDTAH